MVRVVVQLILLGWTVFAAPMQPIANKYYTAYSNFAEGGQSQQILFEFPTPTYSVFWGEKIGIAQNDAACNLGSQLLLEISPSAVLSPAKLSVAVSPQPTSKFGSLPVTNNSPFKLCYCVKSSGVGCSYSLNIQVGVMNVIDVFPRNFAVSNSPGSKFTISLERVVGIFNSPNLKSDRITAILKSGQCGYTNAATSLLSPRSDLTTATAAITNNIKLSSNSRTFEQQVTIGSTALNTERVKLCLCLSEAGCTGNSDYSQAVNSGSVTNLEHKYEIGYLTVHDLKFSGGSTTKSLSRSDLKLQSYSFTYSYMTRSLLKPGASSTFWFALETFSCGDGSHLNSSSTHTPKSFFPETGVLGPAVEISKLTRTLNKKFRLCVLPFVTPPQVALETDTIDLANVALKFSDISLTPLEAIRNARVAINVTWTSSLEANDYIWFVSNPYVCTVLATVPSTTGSQQYTNTQQLTAPGLYMFDFKTISEGSAVRLCRKRGLVVSDLGLQLNVQVVEAFIRPSGQITSHVNAFSVTAATNQPVSIGLSYSVFFDRYNDPLWFMRKGVPCGNKKPSESGPDNSAPVALSGLHANANYQVVYKFDFSKVDTNKHPSQYRLCIHQLKFDQVFDYPYAQVLVQPVTSSPTAAPVMAVTTEISDAGAGAVSASRSVTRIPEQVFRSPSHLQPLDNTYRRWPGITWKFEGQLTFMDTLFFRPVLDSVKSVKRYAVCGEKTESTNIFSVSASAEYATYSTGQATSAPLPIYFPEGRYLICYCNSGQDPVGGNKIERDCSSVEAADMFVGFYVVEQGVLPENQLSVQTVTATKVSVLQAGAVASDRLSLIPFSLECGLNTRMNILSSKAPGILFNYGYEVTAQFPVGWFKICSCKSSQENEACQIFDNESFYYAGLSASQAKKTGVRFSIDRKFMFHVANVYVHDLMIRTRQHPSPTYAPSVGLFHTDNPKVTFKYSFGVEAQRWKVWFARESIPCKLPGFASGNETDALPLWLSQEMPFQFGALDKSSHCEYFRLCVSRNGDIGDFMSIRLFFHRAQIAQWSQLANGQTNNRGMNHGYNFHGTVMQGSSSGVLGAVKLDLASSCLATNTISPSLLWFAAASEPCDRQGSSTLDTATQSSVFELAAQAGTGGLALSKTMQMSAHINRITQFRVPYRLCVCRNCKGSTPGEPRFRAATVDLPAVQATIVPPSGYIYVSCIRLGVDTCGPKANNPFVYPHHGTMTRTFTVASSTVSITFRSLTTSPVMVEGDLIWFRTVNRGCGTSAEDPAVGGLASASRGIFYQGVFQSSQSTAQTFDLSTISFGISFHLRLCVKGSNGYVIDHNTANIYYSPTTPTTPTAPPALTLSPTTAIVVRALNTVPGGNNGLFTKDGTATTLKHMTISPVGTEKTFTWVSEAKINAGQSVEVGDRLAFVRLQSGGCRYHASKATYEIPFLVPGYPNSNFKQQHTLPRLPRGMYNVCFCRKLRQCGYSGAVWDANIGMLASIDADIDQYVTTSKYKLGGGIMPNLGLFVPLKHQTKTSTSSSYGDRVYVASALDCGSVPSGNSFSLYPRNYPTANTDPSPTTLQLEANVATDIPSTIGKYAICYCDHEMTKHCPAGNSALNILSVHGWYGRVGRLIVHDVVFHWGLAFNGYATRIHSGSSVPNSMVNARLTMSSTVYQGVNALVHSSYTLRFVDRKIPCRFQDSYIRWPGGSNYDAVLDFSGFSVGSAFYRLCAKGVPSGSQTEEFLDFGIGFTVTDVNVSPRAPVIAETHFGTGGVAQEYSKIKVNISSSVSLKPGDHFWFHVITKDCEDVTGLFYTPFGSYSNQHTRGYASVAGTTLSTNVFRGNGEYIFWHIGQMTSGVTYRICKREMEYVPSIKKHLQKITDLNSAYIVPMHQTILTPSIVSANGNDLHVRTATAPVAGERYWLRQEGLTCKQVALSSNDQFLYTGTVDYSLGTNTATGAIVLPSNANTKLVKFNGGVSSLELGKRYRLCKQNPVNAGAAMDVGAVVDIDQTFIVVTNLNPTASSLTTVNVPTPASSTHFKGVQVFSLDSSAVSDNQIRFSFEGTVHLGDELGLMRSSTCGGEPVIRVYASNSSSGVTGSSFSKTFPVMPSSSYTLCFCSFASAQPRGGCSNQGAFNQKVGVVFFSPSHKHYTATLKSFGIQTLNLQFFHKVQNGDRVVAVASGSGCRNFTSTLISTFAPSTTTASSNGMTIKNLVVPDDTYGSFELCYCFADNAPGKYCPVSIPSAEYFGLPVGNLVIGSITFNHRSVNMVDLNSRQITVNTTKTFLKKGEDLVWLAKGAIECGENSLIDSATKTVQQTLRQEMVFDFSNATKLLGAELWKLCAKNIETNTVYSFPNVGFTFSDFSLQNDQVNPKLTVGQKFVIHFPLTASTLASSSYFYWAEQSKPCFRNWPTSAWTSSSKDLSYSSMAALSFSGATYQFDFDANYQLDAKPVFRLCLGLSASGKTFGTVLDLSHIEIYPRPKDGVISNPLILPSSNIIQTQNLIWNNEWVWFTEIDKPCQLVDRKAPVASASTTNGIMVAGQSGWQLDISKIATSAKSLRLCVADNSMSFVRDWYSLQVSVVSVTALSNTCKASGCALAIRFSSYFKPGDEIWFDRFSCNVLPTGPTNSNTGVAYMSSPISGGLYNLFLDTTSVEQGVGNALSMCHRRNKGPITRFEDVRIYVADVKLSSTFYGPETFAVEAKRNSIVKLSYSSSSLYSSQIWFTRKGLPCEKFIRANTNLSASVFPPHSTSSTASTALEFDMSSISTEPSGAGSLFYLCQQWNGHVFNINQVEISVFAFRVTPPSSLSSANLRVTIAPQRNWNGVWFRQVGKPCGPQPSAAQGTTTSTQLAVASSGNYFFNFSMAEKAEYRLCGSQTKNSKIEISDHSSAKFVLQCPGNRVGGTCSSCQPGNKASKTAGFYLNPANPSTVECLPCRDACNFRAYECSNTTSSVVCDCEGNFDSAKRCAECKVGYFLDSTGYCAEGSTQAPTRAPTQKPTGSPSTGSPTRKPTAPTPYPCLKQDSPTYSQKCSAWVNAGFCVSSQWSSFMSSNCAKSCCLIGSPAFTTARPSKSPTRSSKSPTRAPSQTPTSKPSTPSKAASVPAMCRNDADEYAKKCPNWKTAGYCTDPQYTKFLKSNCAASCANDSVSYARKCPGWAKSGYCSNQDYLAFMENNCYASCCQSPSGPPPERACKADIFVATSAKRSCGAWATAGYCKDVKYSSWMKENCNMSCCDEK